MDNKKGNEKYRMRSVNSTFSNWFAGLRLRTGLLFVGRPLS